MTVSAAEIYGIRIPDDLSLVGFDDLPFNRFIRPQLTSVRQPVERIALRSVELLRERIEGTPPRGYMETLPVTLTVRGSATAPTA